MAEGNKFDLKIITPDRVFYEGAASMVEFNTTEGEIGVLPGHIPMTVIVKPGILTIYEADGEEKEAALHAGFAEILPEKVGWTILSVVFAFLMNFYVNYCLGMTAFFLVKANGIRVVYQLFAQIFSGALIPLNFFPEILQRVMIFLPFQYTNYIPAMVWTGSENIGVMGLSVPQAVLCQTVATVLMFGFSEVLYRFSMKRFTAVGA